MAAQRGQAKDVAATIAIKWNLRLVLQSPLAWTTINRPAPVSQSGALSTIMLNAMTFLQHLHAPPPGYAVFADGGLLVQL